MGRGMSRGVGDVYSFLIFEFWQEDARTCGIFYVTALSLYKNVTVLGSKKPRQVLTFLKGFLKKIPHVRAVLRQSHKKAITHSLKSRSTSPCNYAANPPVK